MSSPMEKLGARASSSHTAKRPKQPTRPQSEKVSDHSDIRNTLAKKLSEMDLLHETIVEEHNRLIQENTKLSQELAKLKVENAQAIAEKDKDIDELKKEIAEHCEKLERDVNDVELLVQKNKELEDKNKKMHERDCELNRQLCELQERLVKKDKIIKGKTLLVQTRQRDIIILKEKTEQLLHIYENNMKDNLRDISNMCEEICSRSYAALDNQEEAETAV